MYEIDSPKPFYQSRYWELQSLFFEKLGPKVFRTGRVPSRISTSPLLAGLYAQVILGYLRDIAKQPNPPDRVVVLELGAGTGRFSFLLSKALDELVQPLEGAVPKFHYVMSDLAPSNVSCFYENEKTADLQKRGLLSACCLDLNALGEANLYGADLSLQSLIDGAPVVLIANYLFDVLVNDAYRVENGTLNEIHVGLESENTFDSTKISLDMFKGMRMTQTPAALDRLRYDESSYHDILEEYRTGLSEGTFLFPVAGLNALSSFSKMAQKQLFVLMSDQALPTLEDLEGRDTLGMALNGAFASKVNVHAISRWFERQGGAYFKPRSPNQTFDTYGFLTAAREQFPETQLAYETHVSRSSLYGTRMNRQMRSEARAKEFSMSSLLGLLHSGGYDPTHIESLESPLVAALETARPSERQALVYALCECWANAYDVGASKYDLAYGLARLMKRLGEFGRSIELYNESLRSHGPYHRTYFGMAECHEKLGNLTRALHHYEESQNLRFSSRTLERIESLTQKLLEG